MRGIAVKLGVVCLARGRVGFAVLESQEREAGALRNEPDLVQGRRMKKATASTHCSARTPGKPDRRPRSLDIQVFNDREALVLCADIAVVPVPVKMSAAGAVVPRDM